VTESNSDLMRDYRGTGRNQSWGIASNLAVSAPAYHAENHLNDGTEDKKAEH
jgi:hypothetical protein